MPAGGLLLPQRVEPMLAVPVQRPFDSHGHIFEVKWDGVRAIAFISRGKVRLADRKGRGITHHFRDVAAALSKAVKADGVVLDGEIVAPDEKGVPYLAPVMRRFYDDRPTRGRMPLNYEVFDVLYEDYRPLLTVPLVHRKEALRETLRPNDVVHLAHYEEEAGIAFFEAATELGLEGMIGKAKSGVYVPGQPSADWLNVKAYYTGKVVVGGYTIGAGRRKELFGELLLGAYDGQSLRYVGSAGGGFQPEDLAIVHSLVTSLQSEHAPFAAPPQVDRLLWWCNPEAVVEVKFGELPEDGRLRFPIFKGLRPDVAATECTVEALRAEGRAPDAP